MPYIGSKAKRNQMPIDLGDGARVVLRRPSMAEAEALAADAKIGPDGKPVTLSAAEASQETIAMMADLILEWNLCDENEVLVPLDDKDAVAATIRDLPMDVAMVLFEKLTASLKGVGASTQSAERFQGAGTGPAAGDAAQ